MRRLRDEVERALVTGALAVPALAPVAPTGVQTGADARSPAESFELGRVRYASGDVVMR